VRAGGSCRSAVEVHTSAHGVPLPQHRVPMGERTARALAAMAAHVLHNAPGAQAPVPARLMAKAAIAGTNDTSESSVNQPVR